MKKFRSMSVSGLQKKRESKYFSKGELDVAGFSSGITNNNIEKYTLKNQSRVSSCSILDGPQAIEVDSESKDQLVK